MTEQQKQWTDETRNELFGTWLKARHPKTREPGNVLGALATNYGNEPVLRVLDAAEGFETPEVTPMKLGLYALAKHCARLLQPSEVQ